MSKTWTKPTISNVSLQPLPPYKNNANGCLATLLLIVLSLAALSATAQTVTLSEGCSSGTMTDYVLPVTAVNDSGYNVYQSGNRLLEFNVVTKRWEYSAGGNVLFFNNVKSQKPLPPCSFKFDYSHVASCADTTFSVLTDCTILPVELLYFTASPTPQGVLLKWKTASEQNNSHFEIEMSNDGKRFERIAIIPAKGAGIYEFTHDTKKSGIIYYRLKQVDTDGKFTYLKIISLDTSKPNPSVLIEKGVVYAAGRIDVYNLAGQLIQTGFDELPLKYQGLLIIRTKNNVTKFYN